MGKSINNLSSVTVVGLDIAKNVFQVHGVDAKGAAIVARSVRRGQLLKFFASLPRCLVGIEACSSAHHWHTVTGAHFPFISPGLARCGC
jgi:transposase